MKRGKARTADAMQDTGAPLVLVVDDQNSNLQLIGEILDRAGYQVMPALSGQQALARCARRPPDLILLDLVMPELGGVETCRRLRELPGIGDVPILFVTAMHDRNATVTALDAGAVDYITKPFLPEELLARVRSHLDLKRTRDRLAAMLAEREDVIDIVAHDLKNPLTCVLFAGRALARKADIDDETRLLASEVLISAEEALDYIQRFLARGVRAQRLRQFGAAAVDLHEVARQAVDSQRTAAGMQGLTLRVVGEARVWADADVLRNVFRNLLSNAIRYGPPGSEVQVEIGPSSRADHAVCRVMDRGPGVPESLEPRLFQRHASGGDHPGSSGLGLAIAYHDLARLGGRLWYQRREGGGSIFGIELPQTLEAAGGGH